MSLAKYNKKRNFSKSPEPKGKVLKKKSSKLLYIIQKHAASHLHYDFRLELNGVLLSWAVPKGPCLDPSVKRLAMHVEDHPVEYGSFEGIIPKGQYGGGTVMLWDKGEWIPQDENIKKSYQQGSMKFILKGKKLKGLWKLFRINKDDKTWLLVKGKDKYAINIKKFDVLKKEPNSVVSRKTMDEITGEEEKKTKKHLPKIKFNLSPSPILKTLSPQLATLVDEPPSGKNWLHEIKFDGYRIIAIKKDGKTRLLTRNNNDWTNKFKDIAAQINAMPIKNIILDGEIVVLDKNKRSDFQALQNSIKENENVTFYYYIFDLPYYDKYNLTSLTLLERKNILNKILPRKNKIILYSDHFSGSGTKILKKACELSLEGIISKDAKSPYSQSRTQTWLKSKCSKRQEFVIGGYTKPQGMRKYFGALLLGTYNKKGEFIYNGNVGTGFTEASLKSLHKLLQRHHIKQNPFTTRPPKLSAITWVKPALVAEIEFTEWTKDNSLRHPSFKGLRTDKSPKQITREISKSVENNSYPLTHPDKILYPEDKITKQNLANYYEQIQEWILPYVTNRILTLVRCPENYKECFYQKHFTHAVPDGIKTMMIQEKEPKAKCFYIQDSKGLLALPQLGVLEIHPWGSKIEKLEYPDMIIFDLDPDPDLPWKKVVQAAHEVKQHLTDLKLKSFIKTTGGKGLHIVVPIQAEYHWDEIKHFAHAFVDSLVQTNPKAYVGKMTKSARKNKIYIDYLRNQRGATAVAAYSTRARIHAPVSVPISWDELSSNFKDTFFTIKTLPKRLENLKVDPWKDFYKIKQKL